MLANLKAQFLLFTDDLVLLADSESGLQNSMDILNEFCNAWDLKINRENKGGSIQQAQKPTHTSLQNR